MQRFLKKLKNPTKLTGEQIWKIYKGDGSGEEISIEFIIDYCKEKEITLDLDRYYKIYIENNEKALRNVNNLRKDNTKFIEMANILNQKGIPTTDNSSCYDFKLDSERMVSEYKNHGMRF